MCYRVVRHTDYPVDSSLYWDNQNDFINGAYGDPLEAVHLETLVEYIIEHGYPFTDGKFRTICGYKTKSPGYLTFIKISQEENRRTFTPVSDLALKLAIKRIVYNLKEKQHNLEKQFNL